MKKWRNKILSAVLVLSLLLTSSSFAFAVGGDGTENTDSEVKITRSEITALTPSSQQSGAGSTIENAFDGTQTGSTDGTIWHTAWTTDNDTTVATGFKRSVKIELNEAQWISKMIYYPRGGSNNGKFKVCKIYVSEDGESWGDPIASSGTWEWQTDETNKTLSFDPVYTKYLLIYAEETYGDTVNVFASAAEIEIYKNTAYPRITDQPTMQFGSSVELSVTAVADDGGALSYQWYTYDYSNETESLIEGATESTYTASGNDGSVGYFVRVTNNNTSGVYVDSNIVKVLTINEDGTVVINNNDIAVVDYSSQYSETPAKNAIDGKVGTKWETDWSHGSDYERYITLDLCNTYYISSILFTPRIDQVNGTPKILDIYVSENGTDWVLAKTEDWSGDTTLEQTKVPKTIVFNECIKANFVKLHAREVHWDNSNYTFAIAELSFTANIEAEGFINTQPQGGTIASTSSAPLVLSVGAKEGSSYQWYSNDENSYIGATEISNETQASYTPADETKYYFVKVTNGNKSVNSDIVLVKSTEAKITRDDGDYFGTLSEAVNAAQAGETIEIVRDIDLTSDITIGKNITVKSSEGNNFVLNRTESSKGSTLFAVNNGANVTFENVTIDGGAVWSGAEDSVLGRGTTNNGITSTKEFFSVNSNSTLTLNTVTLQNNSRSGNGGVITVDSSTVNIINSVIKNNSSTGFSSVMWASKQNSNVVITNSEIYGNKTTNGTGSTILFEQGADLTISGGEIRNNDGNSNGGAVYLFGESTATVRDNAIISNNKSSNGGAFTLKNNNNAQLIIEDGVQIINNIGGSDGGAIYIARGTVNVGASIISGNHSNWGGAVYVGGGTANFTDTIITENRATNGRGGAFNINKVSSDIATTVNINGNTQISKNSASAHGGAINIQDGTVNLNGGLISENTAIQNGGAIYLGFTDGTISGNGTLNLGSSGNDFALTISGNTAAKGDDIYYGENGTFNINAKLNLDNLFLSMNSGKTPNINCDLLGNTPIKVTIASDRTGRDIASKGTNLDEAAYINSLNVFRVYDLTSESGAANSYKSIYRNNNLLSISATLSLEKDLSSSIYLKGIDNNLFTVTGSENITYTWYVKNADSNGFTKVGENLNSLSDGTYTVYCVASDDTNYMVSDVAEITVKDFYPCSKAIDKFKNI